MSPRQPEEYVSMLRLYHCPGTRSMRSLWLLHEIGIEFELVEMEFGMKNLRTPEYLAISPLGRVPCLSDGALTVFESGAICQYLCETYDDGTLHRGIGDPERAEWLQWLHYAETIAAHAATLIQQQVFIRPEARSEVLIKLESRRLQKALEVIDNHLADREYLLRSGFSAVDTAVGYTVHLGKDLVSIEPFSTLIAYHARCAERPAFQKAAPGSH